MAAIRLKNRHNGFTMLPDRFIDEYMPLASGEYVKVYLYLLRQANLSEPHVSVEDIAEHLMHTEKDIIRALKYWEKQGLLSASFSENRECDSIELLLPEAGSSSGSGSGIITSGVKFSAVSAGSGDTPAVPERPEIPEEESFPPMADDSQSVPAPAASHTAPPRRTYTPQEIEEITERDSLEEMLFVINSYMGRPLSQTELTSIIYIYDQLGFSIELIEYLFEYCISRNHKSIRYIEKTALNWAEEHISTPEEARQQTACFSEDCFAVLRAFGISGRNPVDSEVRFVKRWRNDYHMSPELILGACSRTMAQIHSPSFEYADEILSGWTKAGVKSPEDVKKLDEEFAAKKQSGAGRPASRQGRGQSDAARAGTKGGGGNRSSQTRFSNFEERSYSAGDDADLEKRLLARYRGQKTGT